MRLLATAWRVGWIVVAVAGCAHAQGRVARPQPRPIAAVEGLHFGSLAEVPTGTYAALGGAERRFVLAREGGRLRLDELGADGAVRHRYEPTLAGDRPGGLALGGHYGLTFRRERDGSVRMDVKLCYEFIATERRPGG
ncbi:MAG: hypothetical protein JWM10_3627 [Myxococcaceae bacterium]|nr:hypothetical protein [Myxococcaceae bacterium]